MAFSSKVIREGIKQQMRTGRPPDLVAIQKKMNAERDNKEYLSCRWGKDKDGKSCYCVLLRIVPYDRQVDIHKYYGLNPLQARRVETEVKRYEAYNKSDVYRLAQNPNHHHLLMAVRNRLSRFWDNGLDR